MLYLIRHAQASYLSDDYDKLSNLGIRQAGALGNFLSETTLIHRKYIGPHTRQRQTATYIQEAYQRSDLAIPTPTFIPELKEHSGPATLHYYKPTLILQDPKCSQWNREATDHPHLLRENSIKIFEYFIPQWMAGTYSVDGLEDFATFRKEIAIGMSKILNTNETKHNTVLVTSAGSISAIMAYLLDIQNINEIAQLSLEVYNASVTTLQVREGKWQVEKFNQVDHLTEEMKTVV